MCYKINSTNYPREKRERVAGMVDEFFKISICYLRRLKFHLRQRLRFSNQFLCYNFGKKKRRLDNTVFNQLILLDYFLGKVEFSYFLHFYFSCGVLASYVRMCVLYVCVCVVCV
jgi:hypothetical protein